jgi:hypothetical protein
MLRCPVGLMIVAMITDWLGTTTIHSSISIAKMTFFALYSGFFLFLAVELVWRRRRTL